MATDSPRRPDRRAAGPTARSLAALSVVLLSVLGVAVAVQGAGATPTATPSTVAAAPAGVATPSTAHSTVVPTPPTATATDGATALPSAGGVADGDACRPVANGTPRPDPDADTLGWENGCWYDERIDVDQRDGLNATELDAVLARAMARVERVRRLEFEAPVRVDVVSRAGFEDRVEAAFADTSEAERLRKNVKWEALLMVGEDEDAVAVRREEADAASGYYSPTRERIVVVSADGTTPTVSELTLAHELVHPLQVQHFDAADRFDLATFQQHRTTESLNAINSLLEGDAEIVRMRYRSRCEAEWRCLTRSPDGGGDGGGNAGMSFVASYPYLDGPKFVEQLYDEGGWAAVDRAYETPPESTHEVMHPERYPGDGPPAIDVTDRSDPEWRVLRVDTGQPDYVSVGEPGLTSMMLYTDLDGNPEGSPVVPLRALVNGSDGEVNPLDPLALEANFYASGLEAERLYPYVTDRSPETGETGYVWKLVFESANDSAEFVDGYTQVLAYHGARPVESKEDTYRIPAGEPFADAFYVERTDRTVHVVNAPTVGDLSAVRAGAAPGAGWSLAALPFADEPAWVQATIGVLLVAVLGLSGRLVLVVRRG